MSGDQDDPTARMRLCNTMTRGTYQQLWELLDDWLHEDVKYHRLSRQEATARARAMMKICQEAGVDEPAWMWSLIPEFVSKLEGDLNEQ
jgi:hypothetical protein